MPILISGSPIPDSGQSGSYLSTIRPARSLSFPRLSSLQHHCTHETSSAVAHFGGLVPAWCSDDRRALLREHKNIQAGGGHARADQCRRDCRLSTSKSHRASRRACCCSLGSSPTIGVGSWFHRHLCDTAPLRGNVKRPFKWRAGPACAREENRLCHSPVV